MQKIDVFTHIWPKPWFERLQKVVPGFHDMGKRVTSVPMLMDLDVRFRIMDSFPDYVQILSMSSPPLEMMAPPGVAQSLAEHANDCMAELVEKYPERFPGFIAILALNNPDRMVAETRRAMEQLGAVGILLYTNAAGKALDAPEFRPLFAMMARYDRPIWIHPTRPATFPDYQTENKSQYEIWWTLGWPYETTAAMARLAFSRVLDEFPTLKVITHHGGGMAPMIEGRLASGWDQLGTRTSDVDYFKLLRELKKRPIDYFRMFYADTAMMGSRSSTRCALNFFGADHMVFASDAPFDPEQGPMYIRETIRILDELEISEQDRRKIYRDNAVELLGLKLAA